VSVSQAATDVSATVLAQETMQVVIKCVSCASGVLCVWFGVIASGVPCGCVVKLTVDPFNLAHATYSIARGGVLTSGVGTGAIACRLSSAGPDWCLRTCFVSFLVPSSVVAVVAVVAGSVSPHQPCVRPQPRWASLCALPPLFKSRR